MEHYWLLEAVQLRNSWLTIGTFDGLHLGHQSILKKLTEGAHADGVPAAVLTFHPHPAEVLRGRKGAFYLTTPEERAELLAEAGADVVITHPFTPEVASQSAQEFIHRLHLHLNMQHLCVGHDFALGHGREGNLPVLQRLGETMASSWIYFNQWSWKARSCLPAWFAMPFAGDLEMVNRLLEDHFDQRNCHPRGRAVAGSGYRRLIYRCGKTASFPNRGLRLHCQGERQYMEGIINIGYRPTFDPSLKLRR
jgi:riboflavin kinase/FMN adenylyltransferase